MAVPFDLDMFKDNLKKYLENKQTDSIKELNKTFHVILKGGPIKDIDFSQLDLQSIEMAIDEIVSTPPEEEHDYIFQDIHHTYFDKFLETNSIVAGLKETVPRGGGDDYI